MKIITNPGTSSSGIGVPPMFPLRGIGVPPMSPKHPRGIAVITVVVLFTLISATLLSMSLLFAAQSRRTQAAQSGAQLRQLLLAAAAIAPSKASTITQETTLTLPTPLANTTLTLKLTPVSPTTLEATATATQLSPPLAATQHFTLTQHPPTWQLTATTLTQSP